MNLFDVNSAIENFEFKVDEETGEILNLDELDNLKMQKDEKTENIALYIKNLKAQEKALDEEQKAMYARKKATTNKRQRLEGYLSRFLKGNKFESSKCKISFRNSTQVIIDDEDKFINWAKIYNPQLIEEKVEVKPVKKEILNAINNENLVVEYAHLERERNINIK